MKNKNLNIGKFRFFLISFLIFTFLPTYSAFACKCEANQDWKKATEESAVIFVGHVEKVSEDPIKTKYNKIKFSVSNAIKGLDYLEDTSSKKGYKKSIVLNTPKDAAACGYKFKQNGEYLVYANGSPASLKVSSCSRTNFFELSKEEANKVDELLNYEIEIEEVTVTTTTTTTVSTQKPIPSQLGF